MTLPAVVLDTNTLFSALWNPGGAPARVVRMATELRLLLPCYDGRMMAEHRRVLFRTDRERRFTDEAADALLRMVERRGRRVEPKPLPDVPFTHEDDRMFYEVAVHCDALLITGNLKHYPADPRVMPPDVFLERLNATA